MKKIMFVLVISLFGFSTFAQNTNTFLNHYIDAKDALIAGDSKSASQAIDKFYQAIKSEQDFTQKAELLKATEKLHKATDIGKQRAALSDVSAAMWILVKKSDKVDNTVYYQYCPMKKAYWLSNEKEIKNPYYGSSMLTCGKVMDTKK